MIYRIHLEQEDLLKWVPLIRGTFWTAFLYELVKSKSIAAQEYLMGG